MSNEDIHTLALERFETVSSAEVDNRSASIEDVKFVYNVEGGQWPDDVREERKNDGRPCLTSNKLRKFVAHVANQERDNRKAIRVRPVDDKGDRALAQIYEDLIREIEYRSSADEIYSKGGEQALSGGFGYWRILTEYLDDSFDQDITIKGIENQYSVYYDPRKKFCFIREGLTRKEFDAQYPGVEIVDFESSGLGESYALWYEKDKVFIAEYFYKEPAKKTIAQVVDEAKGTSQIVELKDPFTRGILESKGLKIVRTRVVGSHVVKWCKMTGAGIIPGTQKDWAGKHIPVVEVKGDEVNVEGKIHKRSFIRDGKDPQRMYNYWVTTATEKSALVPKAPYLLTPNQIKNHQAMWDEANIKNRPYLLYNAEGKGIIPKREAPVQIESGIMAMMGVADNDIKDVLGKYSPSLGEKSNERSGKAIKIRSQQSDLGSYHFPDNLSRAIIHTGRILIDLIPKIIDTARSVRIRDYEGEESVVPINQPFEGPNGKEMIYDLSVGKYDVRADIRTYSTRRQESADLATQVMQYAPAIAPFIADLPFKFTDAPGAEEIEQRIKQLIPMLMQQGNGNKTSG